MGNDPRVCDYCLLTVLQSNKPYGLHQLNEKIWNSSLSQGCPFCIVLYKDAWRARNVLPASKQENAHYRWTVRPAGRIRESQEYITITFRPLLQFHVSGDAEAAGPLMERVFFLFPENDLGYLPSAADLGPDTDSAHSRQQVREWVGNCIVNHTKCNPCKSGPEFIPTRLVDLGEPGAEWAEKSIRIVNTARDGIRERYMTLSHCWGRAKPFWNLTKATLIGSQLPEIPLADIRNKNIEEAFTVTRTIGIRYIWIDSLCIVQDDHDDWAREGQLMHQVYRNSHCNIAAVDSQDRDGGLFRGRDQTSKQHPVPVRYKAPANMSGLFGHRTWRVLSRDLWQDEVLGRALYKRAWVFQERLLSSRLIHYSRGQIFWDCATLSACEAIPAGLPAVLDEDQAASDRHWRERLKASTAVPMNRVIGTADNSLLAFWATAVRFYTGCDITKQSDRLRAIWGIAKLVRDAEREEFAAGLWETGLHQQLAWRVVDVDGGGDGSGWERPVTVVDHTHDFSSWSWASVEAPVQVANRLEDYGNYRVTGHNGKALSFSVERRVFATLSNSNDLPYSTPPDMEESTLDDALKAAGVSQSHLDLMPELRCKTLEIQGHVSQGRLSPTSGNGSVWQLEIQSPTGAGGLIKAFPDRRPETETLDYQFVVLCAGNGNISHDEEFFEEGDESEMMGYTWSGNGIMVTLNSDLTYTRIGAVEFTDLDGEVWAALRHCCCQRKLEDGEHAITDGLKFVLA